MSDFTLKAIHEADPQLYYAGMVHSYAFQKNRKSHHDEDDAGARTRGHRDAQDQKNDAEAHRGACFFFAIAAFLRLFGKLPSTSEETKAIEALLDEMGVPPRWRSSGPASSRGAAAPEPSGPSAP